MCKNTLFGGTQTTISGAKVQQKMHIRKRLGKKTTFLYNTAEQWANNSHKQGRWA